MFRLVCSLKNVSLPFLWYCPKTLEPPFLVFWVIFSDRAMLTFQVYHHLNRAAGVLFFTSSPKLLASTVFVVLWPRRSPQWLLYPQTKRWTDKGRGGRCSYCKHCGSWCVVAPSCWAGLAVCQCPVRFRWSSCQNALVTALLVRGGWFYLCLYQTVVGLQSHLYQSYLFLIMVAVL